MIYDASKLRTLRIKHNTRARPTLRRRNADARLYLVSDEDAVEFECNCVDLVKNAIEGLG